MEKNIIIMKPFFKPKYFSYYHVDITIPTLSLMSSKITNLTILPGFTKNLYYKSNLNLLLILKRYHGSGNNTLKNVALNTFNQVLKTPCTPKNTSFAHHPMTGIYNCNIYSHIQSLNLNPYSFQFNEYAKNIRKIKYDVNLYSYEKYNLSSLNNNTFPKVLEMNGCSLFHSASIKYNIQTFLFNKTLGNKLEYKDPKQPNPDVLVDYGETPPEIGFSGMIGYDLKYGKSVINETLKNLENPEKSKYKINGIILTNVDENLYESVLENWLMEYETRLFTTDENYTKLKNLFNNLKYNKNDIFKQIELVVEHQKYLEQSMMPPLKGQENFSTKYLTAQSLDLIEKNSELNLLVSERLYENNIETPSNMKHASKIYNEYPKICDDIIKDLL